MQCRPRAAERCDRPADFVLDYGLSGWAVCRGHVGAVLAFCLADVELPRITVSTPALADLAR